MPKLVRDRVPKYAKHKGYAVVNLGGKRFYLGRYGTKASELEYDRMVNEWLAAGRPARWVDDDHTLTVSELLADYWDHAEQYYRKNGQPTQELYLVKSALGPLRRLYGDTWAADFGPLALESVRRIFVTDGLCRTSCNDQVGRIRRVFRWAVSKQMLPVEVYQALQTVEPLKKGRCEAPETTPVKPVAEDVIQATLAHLTQVVADMVRLQRLCGARPGELVILRPGDLDRSAEVWVYTPAYHKTEHVSDEDKLVFMGPKAQEVLTPYLLRGAEVYCFSPIESEKQRREQMHAGRKTPIGYGNRPGTNKKRKPKRTAGDRYTVASYRRAVHRACDLAFPPPEPLARREGESQRRWLARLTESEREQLKAWQSEHRWSPGQLRHSAGTEIRKRYGLEAAKVILGHKHTRTTEIYAEQDFQLAARVAAEVG